MLVLILIRAFCLFEFSLCQRQCCCVFCVFFYFHLILILLCLPSQRMAHYEWGWIIPHQPVTSPTKREMYTSGKFRHFSPPSLGTRFHSHHHNDFIHGRMLSMKCETKQKTTRIKIINNVARYHLPTSWNIIPDDFRRATTLFFN